MSDRPLRCDIHRVSNQQLELQVCGNTQVFRRNNLAVIPYGSILFQRSAVLADVFGRWCPWRGDLQPGRLGYPHPAMLSLQFVERGSAQPMPAAQLGCRRASLQLLNHPGGLPPETVTN